MNRRIIVIAGILVLALVGFFAYRSFAEARTALTTFQTEAAQRGPLTSTVGATGTVRANQSAVLAFETSGSVEAVDVEVGDMVASGQVIARLKQTSLPSQVILAEADLINAQKALDDLQQNEVAKAQAQLTLAQARDALKTAQYNWQVRQQGYRASSDTIAAAEANLVLANNEVDAAEKKYNALSGRPEDDPARAVALSNLVAARQKRDSILRNLNWYKGKPTDLDQAILDAELAVAQANVDDAQRAYDRVKDGPDSADLRAAKARLAAAEATMETSRIAAPFDGTITSVEVMGGDQVSPGTVAFGLSDLSRLLIDAEISEIDINSVAVGQPVTVEFDAVVDREYQGEVTDVSLTGASVQGVVNFQVTVELLDPDERVKPGMTAAVNIVVEQYEDVLLVPNRAVRASQGDRVVYVLRQGRPQPVTIELGASSDLYSQVVGGELSEGDLIVLNPPTNLFEAGGPGGGPGGGPFGGPGQ